MNTLLSVSRYCSYIELGTTGTTLGFCAEISNPRTSLCRTVGTGSRAGFLNRKDRPFFSCSQVEFYDEGSQYIRCGAPLVYSQHEQAVPVTRDFFCATEGIFLAPMDRRCSTLMARRSGPGSEMCSNSPTRNPCEPCGLSYGELGPLRDDELMQHLSGGHDDAAVTN